MPTARAAVQVIGDGAPRDRIAGEVFSANIILVCTPDDLIAGVAKQLVNTGKKELRGKVVLHTSGALDSSVLAPLARWGAATGSLHPMQTFSGKRMPKLDGIIFAVEGDARARQVARVMARSLGGIPIDIESEDKPAYHAAGALAAGHALALIESATQILMRTGFSRLRAEQTLLPLMRQMLDNFESAGPQAAWTGPVARGDYGVVAKHMRALKTFPPEFAESYATLARLAARVLARDPETKLRELKRALQPSRRGKT